MKKKRAKCWPRNKKCPGKECWCCHMLKQKVFWSQSDVKLEGILGHKAYAATEFI